MKRSGTLWFGMLLVALGVLMLLDNMDVLDFSDVLHTYWPALLVLWGLSVLWRRPSRERISVGSTLGEVGNASAAVYPPTDSTRLSVSTVFGDYTVAVQSKSFTGGSVSTTFGDIVIDLLSAQLAEGEQSLRIDGIFGDTDVRLPRDIAIAVHANTTFGDIQVHDQHKEGISSSLDYTSPGFETAARRLRITVSRTFGDVKIVG